MIVPPADHRPPLPRAWFVLLIAAAAYAVVLTTIAAGRADSTSDFRDFWENAVRYRHTGEISSELGVHNYLPFFTIFMLPWGLLPLRVATALFVLLSLALFAVTVALVENLLGDARRSRPRPAMLIALGLALPYVHSCAVLGNVGLLVLFLVVTAWFLVERGREWPAGVALGLATLLKLLPAVLIVFFLLKRRWRVAGGALGVTVVLGAGVPLLAIGWDASVAQHRSFYQNALRDHSALATLTADQPRKTLYSNNALPIVLRRLLSHTDGAPGNPAGPLFVNVADLPRPSIVAIYGVLMALLLGGSLAVTLGRPRAWPPQSVADGRLLRTQFGVWCGLMLLAAPLVWTHYLPLAYWPLALLTDRAERTYRAAGHAARMAGAALCVWLLAALLLAWPAARAAGAQIAGVLALWIALGIDAVKNREH